MLLLSSLVKINKQIITFKLYREKQILSSNFILHFERKQAKRKFLEKDQVLPELEL